MISKSVLVGEAVLTSILMNLITENVYGVWPLSWDFDPAGFTVVACASGYA